VVKTIRAVYHFAMDLTNPNVLSAYANCAMVIVVAVAALIYYKQLKQMERQTNVLNQQTQASILLSLLRRYSEPEMNEAVRFVWDVSPEKSVSTNRKKTLSEGWYTISGMRSPFYGSVEFLATRSFGPSSLM
jgi:hypothetical protein